VSEEANNLKRVTKECLYLGIEKAVVGNPIGDVMHAVQTHAERNRFSLVRDLLAHGVGREMREEPNFPHIGNPGKGILLKEGMVFTIEPMLNAGKTLMTIDADGWTDYINRTIEMSGDSIIKAAYYAAFYIIPDTPTLGIQMIYMATIITQTTCIN